MVKRSTVFMKLRTTVNGNIKGLTAIIERFRTTGSLKVRFELSFSRSLGLGVKQ